MDTRPSLDRFGSDRFGSDRFGVLIRNGASELQSAIIDDTAWIASGLSCGVECVWFDKIQLRKIRISTEREREREEIEKQQ